MMDELKRLIQKHWGYSVLRPLQEEAMRAFVEGRDSLLVLPTGGGKSLCYQAPALLNLSQTTVVISPLIALMKDQVDGLKSCGIAALQLDSSLSAEEKFIYEMELRQGDVRLLFVSPERLMMSEFCSLLRQLKVNRFAIDEAHCISHWGHDFRPEYRQMARIKELFPGSSVHAYTATATESVRADICRQLALTDPLVLVGNFDRPNLTYRVLKRGDLEKQLRDVLQRHAGEAGIIYCLRRRDVEEVHALCQQMGFKSLPYHAGMGADERRNVQDAFVAEECNLIVATVAFGMGIDRSNIRFVLHMSMPKSIEHYQQETGRAGRDGLEAECILLHSGRDYMTWKMIMEKSAQENDVGPDFLPSALRHLDDIDQYARGAVCRHRALVQYFGQAYPEPNCGACDLCLGDVETVPDAVVVAQKILSCVARVKERFGSGHVIAVLRGEESDRIKSYKHDELTTYGILREQPREVLRDWIQQLVGQGVLMQTEDDYRVLKLNLASWEVMRGKQQVRLVQPMSRKKKTEKGEPASPSRADVVSWEGVDRGLFEVLKQWRYDLAKKTGKPPYIIFSDATLRELARARPSTPANLLQVYGIGARKIEDFGEALLQCIVDHCSSHDVATDIAAAPAAPVRPAKAATMNATRALALKLFSDGAAIEDVMHQTGRSRPTVVDYLCDYITREKPSSIATWIAPEVYERVAAAARQQGSGRLKPIFIALEEKVAYDDIRIVVAHLTRET